MRAQHLDSIANIEFLVFVGRTGTTLGVDHSPIKEQGCIVAQFVILSVDFA